MRELIWIIGGSFALFGVVALIFTHWSPAYIGLILLGASAVIIGWFVTREPRPGGTR